MMTLGSRSASHMAIALFPAAVGPQTTRISTPAESSLNRVPSELHDRRATMHVVRRQRRVAKRDVERAHLAGRQCVASFDRRFASNSGRQSFVARVRSRLAVAGKSGERFTQTPLGIEARMRHRYRANEQRVTAKAFDLEAEPLEGLAVTLERFA